MDAEEIRVRKLAELLGIYSDQSEPVFRSSDLRTLLGMADQLPDIDVPCEVLEFPKADNRNWKGSVDN